MFWPHDQNALKRLSRWILLATLVWNLPRC